MPALPPDQPTSHADAGDGVEVTVNQARGGQRSGRIIWILVISLVFVTVALLGIWLLRAPQLGSAKDGSEKATHSADVNSFQAPQPSPKQAPPDMPSTTGQTTPDASSNAAGR